MKEDTKIGYMLFGVCIGLIISIVISICVNYKYKPQDINRDNSVDAKDLLELRKYLLEDEYDINKDGIVDIRDLSKLQKYIINH